MHAQQTITEMALMRADFYRGQTAEELRAIMHKWVAAGIDPKEITFWETRTGRFRMLVCDVAGIGRTNAGRAWAHMAEDNRQAIRAALRELKTVIADGMNWRSVEVKTRRGIGCGK